MKQKYRAWDKYRKQWVEHFYITENGLIYNMEKPRFDFIGAVPIEKSDMIVMQSTGLFDSSEPPKEIFDGDVVKLHHFVTKFHEHGGAYEDENEITGVIRYGYPEGEIKIIGKVYTPRWYIENKYNTIAIDFIGDLHEESFTVLGNIYEHSHLLEELE